MDNSIFERDSRYIAGTYGRFPVEIVRGEGSLAYGPDGKRYIDLGSGIGVTSFGISDPVWRDAVVRQLYAVQHMSNLYYTDPCVALAERLCERTGMKKVFFSNSGAEANECAIKAARKYAADRYGEQRHLIVTLKNSFHGRTLTTLAATGQDRFHTLFRPLTPGFASVAAGDLEALEKISEDGLPAAVMVECIQGEGGVIPLDGGYLRALSAWCAKNDVLLAVDEVQTGNGRTGALYSYMNFGIMPDIVTTAKGLGGGLPIGATLLGEKCAGVFSPGDHGSTFGGNPVCCAGAVSIIDRIDDELLAGVREKGEMLRKIMEGAPGVSGISGMGLMLGISCERPAAECVRECIDRGVLCLTAKDRIRLLPALNIPSDLLREGAEVILSVCAGKH